MQQSMLNETRVKEYLSHQCQFSFTLFIHQENIINSKGLENNIIQMISLRKQLTKQLTFCNHNAGFPAK